MKILILAIAVSFLGLVLAQDNYIEKEDDSYSSHHPQSGHYGSSYRRYGSYKHSSGYGYAYKRCPKLEDPENGDVKQTGTRPGSKAIHSCDEGFILKGEKVRVCQRDGTWTNEAPTCEPVDCGDPDAPDENGSVDVVETTFKNIATYACNEGYLLDLTQGGSEVVICLASGKWSDTAPACRPVDCGQPPQEDVNGDVEFEETTLDNTATYTCRSGYTLPNGADEYTIRCLSSGEWSSDTAPQCIPVDCGPPPAANDNGDVLVSSTTYRSTAVYVCDDGYLLDTSNGGSQQIYCQADESWSGSAPNCIRVDCGFLPAPENGDVNFVQDTQLGSSAEFSCIKGFKLVGAASRVCQTSGEWSLSQPSCERIQCPKLKAPANAKLLVSGYYVDDYAIYRCAYGYSLSGEKRRVCQEDGTWSGSEPTCEGKKYYDDDDYYGHGRYGRYRYPYDDDDKKEY